ncbi:hypothetical protein BX616_008501 [Lobosporangium transversale]|nr:hypothetical protein BX616_008501 [Lobosporangium transversale]
MSISSDGNWTCFVPQQQQPLQGSLSGPPTPHITTMPGDDGGGTTGPIAGALLSNSILANALAEKEPLEYRLLQEQKELQEAQLQEQQWLQQTQEKELREMQRLQEEEKFRTVAEKYTAVHHDHNDPATWSCYDAISSSSSSSGQMGSLGSFGRGGGYTPAALGGVAALAAIAAASRDNREGRNGGVYGMDMDI